MPSADEECSERVPNQHDDTWCLCNEKKRVIRAQEDCENEGGDRNKVCAWDTKKDICIRQEKPPTPVVPESQCDEVLALENDPATGTDANSSMVAEDKPADDGKKTKTKGGKKKKKKRS